MTNSSNLTFSIYTFGYLFRGHLDSLLECVEKILKQAIFDKNGQAVKWSDQNEIKVPSGKGLKISIIIVAFDQIHLFIFVQYFDICNYHNRFLNKTKM